MREYLPCLCEDKSDGHKAWLGEMGMMCADCVYVCEKCLRLSYLNDLDDKLLCKECVE